MKIYVVRHGQTSWNAQGKIQGSIDIALNETGKAQAIATAKQLEGIVFDRIITSPLIRAYETASIINENYGLPIVVDERIKERSFGEFEGTSLKNMDFANFWDPQCHHLYPTCEPAQAFFDRIYDFIEESMQKYEDETILVVAHGGVSLPFYCYFHGMPDDNDLRKYMLNNCQYARYDTCEYAKTVVQG